MGKKTNKKTRESSERWRFKIKYLCCSNVFRLDIVDCEWIINDTWLNKVLWFKVLYLSCSHWIYVIIYFTLINIRIIEVYVSDFAISLIFIFMSMFRKPFKKIHNTIWTISYVSILKDKSTHFFFFINEEVNSSHMMHRNKKLLHKQEVLTVPKCLFNCVAQYTF